MGKGADKKDVPITHFPIRMAIIAVVAFGAIWGGIFWFLSTCTDSTVPVLDAFTTALSIIAYWAFCQTNGQSNGCCGWRWIWYAPGLYIHKGIPFSATLYGFYTIIAVLGYRKWLRLMEAQK